MAALKPKRPKNRKTGKLMAATVFGYGSSTGYNNRWKKICKRAGIQYLSAHPAGRHGFFTELVVRQGVDPVTAAKADRGFLRRLEAKKNIRIYLFATRTAARGFCSRSPKTAPQRRARCVRADNRQSESRPELRRYPAAPKQGGLWPNLAAG